MKRSISSSFEQLSLKRVKHSDSDLLLLPPEIRTEIFRLLGFKDIANLTQSCQSLRYLFKDKLLMKYILLRMRKPLVYITQPWLAIRDDEELKKFDKEYPKNPEQALIFMNMFAIENNKCWTCDRDDDKIFEIIKTSNNSLYYVNNEMKLQICKWNERDNHHITFSQEQMYIFFKRIIEQYLNCYQFEFYLKDNSSEPLFTLGYLDNSDIYKDFVFTLFSHYHKKYIHILFEPTIDSNNQSGLFFLANGGILSTQYSILTDSANIPPFESFKNSNINEPECYSFDYQLNTNMADDDYYISNDYYLHNIKDLDSNMND